MPLWYFSHVESAKVGGQTFIQSKEAFILYRLSCDVHRLSERSDQHNP